MFELSPVSYALAHADGSLRTCTKSVFLADLEEPTGVSTRLPPSTQDMKTAHIIDGMVQVLTVGNAGVRSFWDLARKHFIIIKALFGE